MRQRRVRDRERGNRWFDDVRVKILGLIAIFESEVLEEGVCRERSWEEIVAEETRRVG